MSSQKEIGKDGMDARPYCQIAGREISSENCFETQGQSGCFGCAASTRRCEACKMRSVAIPATGLCSACITREMEREASQNGQRAVTVQNVHCQMFKKSIRVDMCMATQGQEGCKNCPAPSRLCEVCGNHLVQYPIYGLCLSCAVETFGDDGWKASEIAEEAEMFPEDIFESTNKEESMTHQEAIQQTEAIASDHHAGNDVAPNLCVSCQKQPWRYKKWGMCNSCYMIWYREERKKKETPLGAKQHAQIRKLIPLATDIMQKHKKVGLEFLAKELRISYFTAKKLLEKLARKKFVVISKSLTGRHTYRLSSLSDVAMIHKRLGKQKKQAFPLTQRVSLSTAAKMKTLQGLVETFGETSPAGRTLTAVIDDLKKFERVKKSLT